MDPTRITLPEGRLPCGLQKALNLSIKTSSSSHSSQSSTRIIIIFCPELGIFCREIQLYGRCSHTAVRIGNNMFLKGIMKFSSILWRRLYFWIRTTNWWSHDFFILFSKIYNGDLIEV
jgi:hypothetical protein